MRAAEPIGRPALDGSSGVWRRRSERVLAHLTKPDSISRRQAAAIVAAMVLLIGVADFLLGIRVSLSLFYLVPILLSVAWLGMQEAVFTAVASVLIRVAGDLLAGGELNLPLWDWWNTVSAMLVFLFIVWIFGHLLAIHRRLEERVVESTTELLRASEGRRELQDELLAVGSRERSLMGQELHDDICQHLVGTTLAAKVLAQHLVQRGDPLAKDADGIIALLEEGTAKTRQLARGLLLSDIEPEELSEMIAELVDDGSRSGVQCRFSHAGDVAIADSGVAAQIYRIAQEALRNALRHADATHVEVTLTGDAQALCLTVEDNGRGLPASPGARAGMGLPIMSRRAAYVGATLSVTPLPERGTRLLCRLPIDAPAR